MTGIEHDMVVKGFCCLPTRALFLASAEQQKRMLVKRVVAVLFVIDDCKAVKVKYQLAKIALLNAER